MKRPILSFAVDEVGDPMALLSCGHPQHTRHRPPFFPRPWVLTEEGRAERIGTFLDCVRCEELELPEGFVPFKRTPVFDQDSLPPALRRNHATAAGIWARIHVESGSLEYRIPLLGRVDELSREHPGTVLPEVPHSVHPLGKVHFFVEFLRRENDTRRHRPG